MTDYRPEGQGKAPGAPVTPLEALFRSLNTAYVTLDRAEKSGDFAAVRAQEMQQIMAVARQAAIYDAQREIELDDTKRRLRISDGDARTASRTVEVLRKRLREANDDVNGALALFFVASGLLVTYVLVHLFVRIF